MTNRTIKYRAWHKELKVMIAVYVIDQTTKASTGEHYPSSRGYLLADTEEQVVFSLDDVELLQYTGLKDKNGKEIYVGDVVNVYDKENYSKGDQLVTTDLVKWSEEGGYWTSYEPGDYYLPLGSDDLELKIIGNVYENSDLLT